MPSVIPLRPSAARYEFSTTIDGDDYTFYVYWNDRDDAWYFDVLDSSSFVIASGLKIVLGTYIGRTVRHKLFQSGVLVAWDSTDKGKDATFDDLGTRVLLLRYTAFEVMAEIRGGV